MKQCVLKTGYEYTQKALRGFVVSSQFNDHGIGEIKEMSMMFSFHQSVFFVAKKHYLIPFIMFL